MKVFSIISFLRHATLSLLLALVAVQIAGAKTFTLDPENFQCDVPDDWHTTLRQNNLTFFSQGFAPNYPDILVTRQPGDPLIEIYSPICYQTLEDNLKDHGLRIASRRFVMSNGYQFLEFNAFLVRPDGAVDQENRRFIVADGYVYDILIYAVNADPTANPQLVAARDSFRFLTPPQIPRERSLGFSFFHVSSDDVFKSDATTGGKFASVLFQVMFLGALYSPLFLLMWCGMLVYYFLTRARRLPRLATPPQPSPNPPASNPETSSLAPINKVPPPRRKMGLLPTPRQLPKRPDQ